MCSIPVWQIGKHARALNVSGNMRPRFTNARKNSSWKAPAKVESNLESWRHEEYYYYYSTFRAYEIFLHPPNEASLRWISREISSQIIETEIQNACQTKCYGVYIS